MIAQTRELLFFNKIEATKGFQSCTEHFRCVIAFYCIFLFLSIACKFEDKKKNGNE
jgi:hypothetical protein